MVTGVDAATVDVVMLNDALVAPAATVTVAGAAATAPLLNAHPRRARRAVRTSAGSCSQVTGAL
jgi:hypothetical protein